MKVTMYRVDSTTNDDSVYLPLKSMAELWDRTRSWEYDRRTSKTVIDNKGLLSIMLAPDAELERRVGAFLKSGAITIAESGMNNETLAQEMDRFVKILEIRSDCEEFGDKARNRFGVARNLVAQAITETKYATKYAMQEAKAAKGAK